LSYLAVNRLPEAIQKLKDLDVNVLDILRQKLPEILYLKNIISETLDSGKDVYFCGCGATGRLSLTIETLWRQTNAGNPLENRVFSFMSGGDVALIRSIENFEDYPAYGARQLIEAGFKDGDLLVCTTEGGETPFVIGAAEKAAEISVRKPFFLYCNPDDLLCAAAERSKKVIENEKIEKINLTVGPMAVTGSTRMQSSTILLAVAGAALFYCKKSNELLALDINAFAGLWTSSDLSFIEKFIVKESEYYSKGEYLLYETDGNLGITVITDTTERSPTFSLYPFENVQETDMHLSLCYLYLPGKISSEEAWLTLLSRKPRTLEWTEIQGIASMQRLVGFDFSDNIFKRRENGKIKQHRFKILDREDGIYFNLEGESHLVTVSFPGLLFKHLYLKMVLNIHSTIIMGRLGRYEGNVMTYLRASNNKLIDRSIRYIDLILREKNISLSYDEICYVLFEVLDKISADQAIVVATVDEIVRRYKPE
jgi:N-acetylmuramic acid 6-phosphate etherase